MYLTLKNVKMTVKYLKLLWYRFLFTTTWNCSIFYRISSKSFLCTFHLLLTGERGFLFLHHLSKALYKTTILLNSVRYLQGFQIKWFMSTNTNTQKCYCLLIYHCLLLFNFLSLVSWYYFKYTSYSLAAVLSDLRNQHENNKVRPYSLYNFHNFTLDLTQKKRITHRIWETYSVLSCHEKNWTSLEIVRDTMKWYETRWKFSKHDEIVRYSLHCTRYDERWTCTYETRRISSRLDFETWLE